MNEFTFVRAAYNYDVDQASDEAGLDCSADKGRTQQHFEEESNINTIIARVFKTGEFPAGMPMIMQGDFTDANDFQSSMDLIVKARESFDAMPAKVRTRFDNDPGKFIAFVSDDANFDEAVSFGLVRPEVSDARRAKAEAARAAEVEAAVKARLEAAKQPGAQVST